MSGTNFRNVKPPLSSECLAVVTKLGFTNMTPVQATAIPLFLQNKDVCVEATTGSGKTLSFGIPVFEMLARKLREGEISLAKHDVGALIISPTRELALQIFDVLSVFMTEFSHLRCTLFVGGTSVMENVNDFIKNGGQIVIGTPGRILDVTNRTTEVNWKKLEILVLDEADKLLDMGFRDSLNQIFSILPKQRRTGLFSATQTKEVKELARAGLRNPVSVSVRVQHKAKAIASAASNSNDDGRASSSALSAVAIPQATPTSLDNWYMVREYDARILELIRFIQQNRSSKIIVFCATCACVDYYSLAIPQLLKALLAESSSSASTDKKITVVGFHGKMVAKKRTIVYQKFKHVDSGVMFSTDVAARGLDLPDVDWIVQLAAPKDPAFFVHRVGRTARAGRKGGALLFITPEEEAYIELLRGRGVPLRCANELSELFPLPITSGASSAVTADEPPKKKKKKAVADVMENITTDTAPSSFSSAGDVNAMDLSSIAEGLKSVAKKDRDALEKGSTAFMSFVRAYKEHLCSFIFRLEYLDLGAVARSYGLLRLPKIAETRGVKGKPIVFDTDAVDTSTISYKHTEKEAARVRKLQQSLAAEAAAEEAEDLGSVNSGDSNRGQIVPLSARSVRSMRSMKSTRSSKTGKTGKTGTKTVWVPAEQFERKEEKRERGKKKSIGAKLREEWEELAAEEGLFRKFKKGKLSKEKYDETLTSAERQAREAWDEVDAENQKTNSRRKRPRGGDSDSDDDGGFDGDSGASGSDFDEDSD